MIEEAIVNSLKETLKTAPKDATWAAHRIEALSRFERSGLPKIKDELWKYTSPQTFVAGALPWGVSGGDQVSSAMASGKNQNSLSSFEQNCFHLQIIDGKVSAASLEEVNRLGLKVSLISACETKLDRHVKMLLEHGDGLQNLGFAAQSCALLVEVPAQCELTRSLLIDFQMEAAAPSGLMVTPIVCVELGQRSFLKVIERYSSGAEKVWQQPLISYWQEESSRLHVARIIRLHDQAQMLSFSSLYQETASEAELLTLVTSGKLVRCLNHVHQAGESAFCRSHGLALLKPHAHCDLRSFFSHNKPSTSAEQLFKSVVSEKGRFVFNGKIFIGEGAQKTHSSMLNKNLLLGSLAEADCKPELEVYADDVKANHGASVGQLDQSELFYLMSRGLSQDKSLELLARGYIEDVVLSFSSRDMRDFVFQQLAENLKDMIHRIEGH